MLCQVFESYICRMQNLGFRKYEMQSANFEMRGCDKKNVRKGKVEDGFWD